MVFHIESGSPALQADSLPPEPLGEPDSYLVNNFRHILQ